MKKIILLLCLAVFAGCATDKTLSESANEDYEKAKGMLDDGYYDKANLFLQEFGAKHPYSQHANQAELLRVFAAYKAGEYISSEVLAEKFTQRHPRHPDVAYAKYLLAMSHYKQVVSSEKDQTETLKSIKAFQRLIKEHPRSTYAGDVRPRLQRLENQLGAHELNVGKFYFDKKRYVAAVNRFQMIVKKYQTTPAIEEALYYLAASFAALGVRDSAHDIAVLLQHNYPKGEWSEEVAKFL
ncbi:MAG: outer membrane protein assembly factor BamD [Mariprofundaceae bacterium]